MIFASNEILYERINKVDVTLEFKSLRTLKQVLPRCSQAFHDICDRSRLLHLVFPSIVPQEIDVRNSQNRKSFFLEKIPYIFV